MSHQKSAAPRNTCGKLFRVQAGSGYLSSFHMFQHSNISDSFASLRIDTNLCADRTTHSTSSKYWADKSGRCYQDSVNPTEDLSAELYDSIEDCCAGGVSWLSPAKCLAASEVDVSGLGSNSFYIQNEKCVQDCEGAAPCGGLAERWDTKFDSRDECCAELPWIARRDCVLDD